MTRTNPFAITYGDQSVGGSSSTYLLSAPYVIDKSPSDLRLVFEVLVVAGSHEGLKGSCATIEQAFSKRDQSLAIAMGGSTFEYVFGTDVLNTAANLAKTGKPQTDRGYSRAYTCSIEGKLPANDLDGLREVAVSTHYEASRQQIVTMRGIYTALHGTGARATYVSNFDSEAETFLNAIDSEATWELADEDVSTDRLDHHATFTRQYVQLLADQSQGTRDDDEIRDHRVVFNDQHAHLGDASQNIARLRHVVATYDCAIDIEQTQDLQSVWDDKIKPHIVQMFRDQFEPQVLAIEDVRVSYDETRKRLSSSLRLVYRKQGGASDVVEVSESVAYREQRTIDYTPVHGQGEFSMEADQGWGIRERVWSRTAIALGEEAPKRRIGGKTADPGPAGLFDESYGSITGVDERNTGDVVPDGWNVTSSSSQVSRQWVGDPDGDVGQMLVSVLTESVVERYHTRPSGGGTTTPGSGS